MTVTSQSLQRQVTVILPFREISNQERRDQDGNIIAYKWWTVRSQPNRHKRKGVRFKKNFVSLGSALGAPNTHNTHLV